jgi:hypothetical protein
MADVTILLGILASLALTFMTYSFLIKSNFAFDVAQNIFVGVSVGISSALAFNSLMSVAINPLPKEPLNIVPILLGLMLFAGLLKGSAPVRKLSWWGQFPLALIVATGFSISLRADVEASFWRQLLTIWNSFNTTNISSLFDAFVIFIGAITTICYFIYTRSNTGIMRTPNRIGRLMLMLFFGASFGNVIISRMTVMIGLIYNMIESLRILLQAIMGT